EVARGRAAPAPGACHQAPGAGMRAPPVVPPPPPPVPDLDALPPDLQPAVEDRVRIGAEELGLGQLRAVEELARQMMEGLVVIGEAEVPAGREHIGLELAGGPPVGEGAVGDSEGGVRAGAERVRPELALGRLRPRGGGVEEDEPERAGRLLARALVDRVADPGGLAATRLNELQIEALVVARLPGDVGEASLGAHPVDAIE